MHFHLLLYNIALHVAGLPMALLLKKRSGGETLFWRGRFGSYDLPQGDRAAPRLWFHAASVGEVTGAVPTLYRVKERFPRAQIFLTVGTVQGFRFAQAQLPSWATVLPFPLDFPWVQSKVFETLNPDLYVGFEGEFWPNLLHQLQLRRIPSVLLNGRVSRRSVRRYALLKNLLRPLATHFSILAMLTREDRDNMVSLGVSRANTLVLGSSKYEALPRRADSGRRDRWKQLLHLDQEGPVVVGGSLRRGECTQLLEVFVSLKRKIPETVGIFAPRHMKQIPVMARWLEDRQIPYHLLSRLERGDSVRHRSVVLVDRIGILFELYGTGDLIFCGGTLEPIGGHNILEPAAWSRAVFYGPHLQKVQYEHKMLHSSGGGFVVKSSAELLEVWEHWVKDLPGLARHGEKAREALDALGGVAAKHLEIIESVLTASPRTMEPNDGKAQEHARPLQGGPSP